MPATVTLTGSPLKTAMLSRVHSRAVRWSRRPMLPTHCPRHFASSASACPLRNPSAFNLYAGTTMIARKAESFSKRTGASGFQFADPHWSYPPWR